MCLCACVYIVWAQLGELEALCAWRADKRSLLVAAVLPFFFSKAGDNLLRVRLVPACIFFARPRLLASGDFLRNELNGLLPYRPY